MISGKTLWNYFARPVAQSPAWHRVTRAVDAFENSGKGHKKKEPNPVYSENIFSIGPDSILP